MRKKAPVAPPVPTNVDFSKTIIFIKNCSREGPGAFDMVAAERGVPVAVYDIEAGHPLPPVERVKAVVMLGGPESANDDNPSMTERIEFVGDLVRNNVPYLGVCLGMQMLVKAVGGTVYKHALKEIGSIGPDRMEYTMALNEAGRHDALFRGWEKDFPPVKAGATSVLPVFQLHGETVALPAPGAELIATGLFCTNQAIRVGERAWGVQGHIEVTRSLLEIWANEDEDLRSVERIGLIRNFQASAAAYERGARLVFKNFLSIAGL